MRGRPSSLSLFRRNPSSVGSLCLTCLACLASFLISQPHAAATEDAKWYQTDFPPYIILSGLDKGRGIDDQITVYVMKRFPEYDFSLLPATYSRILDDLKAHAHGVMTPMFKTPEREKFVLYTDIASYLVLPNGLIINRAEEKRFQPYMLEDGTLDIEAICSSGKFVIGIASGRSYSGILDDMIRKYADTRTFHVQSGLKHLAIMKMVQAKRVDAAFGFPVEVRFAGLDKDLMTLRVSKMVSYIPVYFGMPKNDWGNRLAGKLNALLRENGTLAEFSSYYESWLDDKDKEYYKKLSREYYSGQMKAKP